MEEAVTKLATQHDQNKEHAQTIGIFIINNKSEMLLQKKLSPLDQLLYWQPPYFIYHENSTSSSGMAKIYVHELGIDCEFHEVFSPTTDSNRIIIALTKELGTKLNSTSNEYKWMPIAHVLHAIHDQPKLYASWFRAALEGTQLYVKNIINNQSCNPLPPQTELQ